MKVHKIGEHNTHPMPRWSYVISILNLNQRW
jgi:hypothetical protein